MAQQIKDLQKLIEEKATKRLNEDFNQATISIQRSELFKDIKLSFNNKEESPYWIFNSNGEVHKAIFEKFLPIYITQECERFVQSVESLQKDVNDLLNGVKYDDY